MTSTIVVVSAVDGCNSPLLDALGGVLAVVVLGENYFRAGFLDVTVPFVVVPPVPVAVVTVFVLPSSFVVR